MRFSELDLDKRTLDAIAAMGYGQATPIQAQALGPLLEGRDLVGQARTGSGKTAAFGIPIVDALHDDPGDLRGLVLVPTRELAVQVAGVLGKLAQDSRLAVVPVYGGAGFGKQHSALKRTGPKVVVATPGRLLDHVGRGTLRLDAVSHLVLDEADRMLDMGFIHDMRRVLEQVPAKRQTMLFSATLSKDVLALVDDFTTDAVRVHVDAGAAAPGAEQFMVRVEQPDKQNALLHLLHEERPERAIVFTRTKHLAKRLARSLDAHGWSSVALQGDMTQSQRERSLDAFRDGKARVLVATDVAARGLDVPGVSHVVNHDLPDEDSYVHRVGRTARNGAAGRAYTFVQRDEERDMRDIERIAGTLVLRVRLPTDAPAEKGPDTPSGTGGPQGHRPRPKARKPHRVARDSGHPRRPHGRRAR